MLFGMAESKTLFFNQTQFLLSPEIIFLTTSVSQDFRHNDLPIIRIKQFIN